MAPVDGGASRQKRVRFGRAAIVLKWAEAGIGDADLVVIDPVGETAAATVADQVEGSLEASSICPAADGLCCHRVEAAPR